MMNYDKLTKKELIYTLIARDEMLKNCRERFELHKTTDATTIQDQSDLIDVLNKALELACQTIKRMCPPLWIGGNVPPPEVKDAEYFIEKAKEEMKSE